MKNKILVTTILIATVVFALAFYTVKYTLDPFGAPPKGSGMNCGPEGRYKFDAEINSKEDFVDFLKTSQGKLLDQYGNDWVRLDSFRIINESTDYQDIQSAEINWNRVLSETKTQITGFKIIYVLDYNPIGCSGYTLKMTADGHVSVYGCCGK